MRGCHTRHDYSEGAFWHAAGKFGGRGRGGFGPFGYGTGGGGRGGPGDLLRAGRMLADGDLKLIALALLDREPRHGYDIIKALEQLSSGFYSPSPGVVYPTLTYLEEAGFAISAAEGNKKVYAITAAGREHLAANRELVDRVLEQIERFGRKMAKAREWFGWSEDAEDQHKAAGHQGEFRTLRRRIRAALAEVVEGEPDKRQEALQILETAADALEALARR